MTFEELVELRQYCDEHPGRIATLVRQLLEEHEQLQKMRERMVERCRSWRKMLGDGS